MSITIKYSPWSQEKAASWKENHPWLIGCNYTPAYATNSLEFWQEKTFDIVAIESELALAQKIGFNSLRVYLHHLLWRNSSQFLNHFEMFLNLADKYGIGTLPVFFDSCWHPYPHDGEQRPPERGVHNSGWVQSPGLAVLSDPNQFAEMESYVTGVVERFRDDRRIHGWDIWNEPDNPNTNSYGTRDMGERKGNVVLPYLAQTFDWVRGAGATQPATCGVWRGEWDVANASAINRLSIEGSDILSFHWYGDLETTKKKVDSLKVYERPLICTEYMARGAGSVFETILPYFKEEGIGGYNWGFVQGRTQTHLPWDSWQKPCYEAEPPLWFHEIFRSDHTPYRTEEVDLIRSLTR